MLCHDWKEKLKSFLYFEYIAMFELSHMNAKKTNPTAQTVSVIAMI